MCPRIKAKIHFIRLATTKSARGEFQLLTHSRPCYRTRALSWETRTRKKFQRVHFVHGHVRPRYV